jgi:hypothetical protein
MTDHATPSQRVGGSIPRGAHNKQARAPVLACFQDPGTPFGPFGWLSLVRDQNFHHISGLAGGQLAAEVAVLAHAALTQSYPATGAACSHLRAAYQSSPTGSPAMFQLHDTVGVIRRNIPGPNMPTRSTGPSATPYTRTARATKG